MQHACRVQQQGACDAVDEGHGGVVRGATTRGQRRRRSGAAAGALSDALPKLWIRKRQVLSQRVLVLSPRVLSQRVRLATSTRVLIVL